MRVEEMFVGDIYAMSSPDRDGPVRVTLVSTIAVQRAHVRVRVGDGPRHGELEEVPSVRLSPWSDRFAQPREVETPVPEIWSGGPVAWIPRRGQEVERRGYPGWIWIVESVDLQSDTVTIRSTILGKLTIETVGHSELGPAPPRLRTEVPNLDGILGPAPVVRPTIAEREQAPPSEEVSDPDEDLVSLVDRFFFSPECCTKYREALAPRCPISKVPDRMREELRQRGRYRRRPYDSPRRRRGEYIRYRVPRRFEVILFESPSKVKDDIHVKHIEILKWFPKDQGHGRQAERRRRRRRRGRRRPKG